MNDKERNMPKYISAEMNVFVEITEEALEAMHDKLPFDRDGYKDSITYFVQDEEGHMLMRHFRCVTPTSVDGCTYCAAGFTQCGCCNANDYDYDSAENPFDGECPKAKDLTIFKLEDINPHTSIFLPWFEVLELPEQASILRAMYLNESSLSFDSLSVICKHLRVACMGERCLRVMHEEMSPIESYKDFNISEISLHMYRLLIWALDLVKKRHPDAKVQSTMSYLLAQMKDSENNPLTTYRPLSNVTIEWDGLFPDN